VRTIRRHFARADDPAEIVIVRHHELPALVCLLRHTELARGVVPELRHPAVRRLLLDELPHRVPRILRHHRVGRTVRTHGIDTDERHEALRTPPTWHGKV